MQNSKSIEQLRQDLQAVEKGLSANPSAEVAATLNATKIKIQAQINERLQGNAFSVPVPEPSRKQPRTEIKKVMDDIDWETKKKYIDRQTASNSEPIILVAPPIVHLDPVLIHFPWDENPKEYIVPMVITNFKQEFRRVIESAAWSADKLVDVFMQKTFVKCYMYYVAIKRVYPNNFDALSDFKIRKTNDSVKLFDIVVGKADEYEKAR